MAPPINSPLTDEHCDIIDGCLQECNRCKQLLALMRQAGFPAETAEQQVAMHETLATNLKATFFPHRA